MVEISHQLVHVYGEEVMSRQSVAKWCSHFKSGWDEAKDYERSGSRKLSREQSTCWSSNLEEQKSDCEWALSWFWSFILVRSIQDLGCHKVCVRWVLRALSEDHKLQGMFSAVSFLLQYAIHGHDFLKRIITGDWTWVHHHSIESQRASIEWKPPWFP